MTLRIAACIACLALTSCNAHSSPEHQETSSALPYDIGFELTAIGDIEAITAGRWLAEDPNATICCTMTWRYVELARAVDQYIRQNIEPNHDSSNYVFSFAVLEGEAEVSLTPLSAADISSDLALDGYWIRVDLDQFTVVSWDYQR